MTIKLNVKKGIILIGVMFLLAITVSYADTQIQREDIKGSFVVGRVQTAQDVILVYSQISPATADLTSLSFGTGDIDAFGALVTAPKVEFWAANGGGTPFNLTLEGLTSRSTASRCPETCWRSLWDLPAESCFPRRTTPR